MFRIFAIVFGAILLVATPRLSGAQVTGTCPRSLGEAYLDANNVRARILNTGGLFYRGEPSSYEVPIHSGLHSIFAGALWIGGMVDGKLHMSAARYGNNELWAGPIDDAGMPPADCRDYDRIYKVSIDDIAAYDASGNTTIDLREWPTGLGAPTVDASGLPVDLLDRPFESRKDRLIDLANGERPAVRGEQLVWWLMNDQGNAHNTTDANPLGLEVHASAFARGHPSSINETTLFHFRLRNRSSSDISDAFVGVFLDVDLGNFDDDHIGADSIRGMGYFYNGDNDDEGEAGYGPAPPALGIMFLEGPVADVDLIDNDGDGETDEFGERLRTTMISPHGEQLRAYEEPASGPDYYRQMQGFWRSGEPHYTVGDQGHGYSNRWTNFVYSGDPISGSFWTEVNSDSLGTSNSPGERRMLITSGPFSIAKSEENDLTIAITWARGNSNLNSITELRKAADHVRFSFDAAVWDALRLYTKPIPIPNPNPVSSVGANFPDPFSEATTIEYQVSEESQVRLVIYNSLGKRVATLVNQVQPPGEYSIPFEGAEYPSGVYFYRLEIGHASGTRSMVLLK